MFLHLSLSHILFTEGSVHHRSMCFRHPSPLTLQPTQSHQPLEVNDTPDPSSLIEPLTLRQKRIHSLWRPMTPQCSPVFPQRLLTLTSFNPVIACGSHMTQKMEVADTSNVDIKPIKSHSLWMSRDTTWYMWSAPASLTLYPKIVTAWRAPWHHRSTCFKVGYCHRTKIISQPVEVNFMLQIYNVSIYVKWH